MEDTTTNYSTIIISVLMAVVIIATVMIPIITATTQTTTTTEIDNEGAGWLKLGYSSGEDFDFEITNENSNISIGDQTGTIGDNIFYADSKNVIFADSGKNAIFLLDTESSSVHKFSSTVSVENTEGTLNISDGTETVVSSESPTWAYIPDNAGTYGFFANGGLSLEEDKPTVAVGSYAGVFAYNDTVVGPQGFTEFGLVKTGDYSSGEVVWELSSALNTMNLDPLSIQPTDLGGSGSVGLMAVVPGTYTDGSFTFNIIDGNACIMSCTDTGIDHLEIPSTVSADGNTYTVTRIGNGDEIISNDQLNPGCTLTIPDTVTSLGYKSFANCSNLGGEIVLPSGLTTMAGLNFSNCTNITGSIVIPSGTTQVPIRGFQNTHSIDGTIILPASVNTIPSNAFYGCGAKGLVVLGELTSVTGSPLGSSGIKEVLNLGQTEITTTSYGLNADSVQDHVSALGYVAPVSIHNTIIVEDTSLSATLLKLLPVFMVLAVVIFIGYAMYRPDSEFVQSLKNKL